MAVPPEHRCVVGAQPASWPASLAPSAEASRGASPDASRGASPEPSRGASLGRPSATPSTGASGATLASRSFVPPPPEAEHAPPKRRRIAAPAVIVLSIAARATLTCLSASVRDLLPRGQTSAVVRVREWPDQRRTSV